MQREQVKKIVCRERRDEAVRSYSLIENKPESEKKRKKRVGWGVGGVRFCHSGLSHQLSHSDARVNIKLYINTSGKGHIQVGHFHMGTGGEQFASNTLPL